VITAKLNFFGQWEAVDQNSHNGSKQTAFLFHNQFLITTYSVEYKN